MSPKLWANLQCFGQLQSERENCFSVETSESHWRTLRWRQLVPILNHEPIRPLRKSTSLSPKFVKFRCHNVYTTRVQPVGPQKSSEKPFANQIAYWSPAPLNGSMHELLHMTCHSLECTSLPAASRNTRARRTRLLSPNFPMAAGFQEFWT